MTLVECMGKMSHREFKVRLALLNRPTRIEHYLMRLISALAKGGDYMKYLIPQANVKNSSSQQKSSGEARARQTHGMFSAAFGSGKKKEERTIRKPL